MGVALRLYKGLTDAGEDSSRAQVIADAFEELESRYPDLKDMATQGHVRESELRLQKEIKAVELEIRESELRLQKEIKEVEARLQKDIQTVQLEIREVEARLAKDIQATQLEIREVETRLAKDIQATRLEIREVETKLTQAIHRQTVWVIVAIASMTGILRWLDVALR